MHSKLRNQNCFKKEADHQPHDIKLYGYHG